MMNVALHWSKAQRHFADKLLGELKENDKNVENKKDEKCSVEKTDFLVHC